MLGLFAQANPQPPPDSFSGSIALADGVIAVAYLGIAATLLYMVRHRTRPGLLYPLVFVLFAAAVAGGALDHGLAAASAWAPSGLTLAAKLLTAVAALLAVVALIRVAPAVLALPSRDELRREKTTLEDRVESRTADLTEINGRLRRVVAQREDAEAEVRRLNGELQARLAELKSLFRLLPVGVAISTDASCRELRANQAFANLLGTLELKDTSPSLSPFEPQGDFRVMHDGRELRPTELPMQRSIATLAPVRDFEASIVRADGTTVEVIANAVPLIDAEGQPRGSLATFQDITAHKHAERNRLDFERKLLQSQKLESIGVLAGGIAHDFNNLLTGILGHSNFARSELARGSANIDHLLAQVELSAQRAAELCRQLLSYAGKGRFVVRLIDLNLAVEQAVPLITLSASKKVTLDLQLGAGLPPFKGDPTQLNQLLMNLVANASEAIGTATGTVTLRTHRVVLSAMEMLTLTVGQDAEPGSFVCLEVKDTGCGIPPEALPHIFEPFFTTKSVGRGLGLAAVLGIVQGHRGAARVSSQVGTGTTFELFFPVAPVPAPDTPPSVTAAPLTRSGTILVVDDEPTVRSLAAAALTSAGFKVETAVDGEDALNQVRRDPLRFDAVLLDMSMPKLDGEDTLLALRMLTPTLPVVLTSGHSEQTIAQRFVGRGIADFLAKPFVSETLVHALDTAIARVRQPLPPRT